MKNKITIKEIPFSYSYKMFLLTELLKLFYNGDLSIKLKYSYKIIGINSEVKKLEDAIFFIDGRKTYKRFIKRIELYDNQIHGNINTLNIGYDENIDTIQIYSRPENIYKDIDTNIIKLFINSIILDKSIIEFMDNNVLSDIIYDYFINDINNFLTLSNLIEEEEEEQFRDILGYNNEFINKIQDLYLEKIKK